MRYRRLTSSCFSVGRNIHLTKLRKELREYMAGLRTDFTVALDLQGTAFQRTVWNALRALPYGAQISYNDLAVAVSRPEAVRAVGAANGANPLSIVVPCHRILGSNGQLTGYGGGIERKAWLLSLESEGTCR
ncbi:MAG: methylated-DNA--[protein]-cysteine S-methyltransferase [Granulosicoccus sp.]|nr:methylated-DNA--[protein]-cysteine S-methyltransferase [Granulosicoccus sp.]